MKVNKLKEKVLAKLKKTMKNYRTNKNITLQEAKQISITTKNVTLIDVRSLQEYKEYHIDGAICIPHYEIANKIQKAVPDKNAIVILYCQSGIRSKNAVEILTKKGYQNVYHVKNGLEG